MFYLFILGANMLVALGIVLFIRRLRERRQWFTVDHLNVPTWMKIASVPLGFAIPATPGLIDIMLFGAALYIHNEWRYQRTGKSWLGRAINAIDVRVMRYFGKDAAATKSETSAR